MLDDLRRQRDIISLEAASGDAAHAQALSRLGSYIKSMASAIVMSTYAPLKQLFAKSDVAAEGRAMEKIPYNAIRHLPLRGMAGQQVDFLTIATHLEKCAVSMNTLERDVLTPFSSWVANKLSNPSTLASLSGTLAIPGYKPHDLAGFDKEFRTFFESGVVANSREIPYGMAFRRNADWGPLADKMGGLEKALVENGQHKRIRELVDNIDNMLGRLIQRIEEDGETYKVSPTTLHALADAAYTVANEMQFYSMLTHRVVLLSESVKKAQAACEQFRKTYTA